MQIPTLGNRIPYNARQLYESFYSIPTNNIPFERTNTNGFKKNIILQDETMTLGNYVIHTVCLKLLVGQTYL